MVLTKNPRPYSAEFTDVDRYYGVTELNQIKRNVIPIERKSLIDFFVSVTIFPVYIIHNFFIFLKLLWPTCFLLNIIVYWYVFSVHLFTFEIYLCIFVSRIGIWKWIWEGVGISFLINETLIRILTFIYTSLCSSIQLKSYSLCSPTLYLQSTYTLYNVHIYIVCTMYTYIVCTYSVHVVRVHVN